LDAQDDPPLDIQGPITRARARQLNLQVSSFLSKSLYDFENKLLPNNYIVLQNHGEDQGMHKGWLRGVENQQGRPSQEEAQTESILSLFRNRGPARSKTDAQDAPGLHFRCSTYGWKDNFIKKPMALV